MSEKAIQLVEIPTDHDYEDYISAYLQAGGMYLERNVIYRGEEELMELDVIVSDIQEGKIVKRIFEIKSGKWGFSDIFKVKGQLVYLGLDEGVFVVQKPKGHFGYYVKKAKEMNISLIDNSDLGKTDKHLSEYVLQPIDEVEIKTIRFSYMIERKMLAMIKQLKSKHREKLRYQKLDDYLFQINSASFFNAPFERIETLFTAFIENRNITAKVSCEIETGKYDNDVMQLPLDSFKRIFYACDVSIMQVAIYVEHLARITVLKCCIEYSIVEKSGTSTRPKISGLLRSLRMPSTIQSGLTAVEREPFYHRYPVFWQFFTYVMGGFILLDFKDQEYDYISRNTGIPVEELPRAFDSYDKFFPRDGGWMFNAPNTNIHLLRFFPPVLSGIGANHRRVWHLNSKERKYEELYEKLTGQYTYNTMIRWNNLSHAILSNKQSES